MSVRRRRFIGSFVGRTVRVLFERREKSGLYTGFSDNYIKVGVSTRRRDRQPVAPVRFDGMADGMALGTLDDRDRITSMRDIEAVLACAL